MEDQRPGTRKHISIVEGYLKKMMAELQYRSVNHDKSKLIDPERQIFDKYIPKLKTTAYGSDEYNGYLEEMEVGLNHHYRNNRHHPEHFFYNECNDCSKKYYGMMPSKCSCGCSQLTKQSDVNQMNLIDIMEMFCDWKAASIRHKDGDINKSIEINKKRFGITDQLAQILKNTIDLLDKGE